jgi:hypothetical protein
MTPHDSVSCTDLKVGRHRLGSTAGLCQRDSIGKSTAPALRLPSGAEIDGNLCFLLDPRTQLIEGKLPLAATLLRRAMVEDTLDAANSTPLQARGMCACNRLTKPTGEARSEAAHCFAFLTDGDAER